LIRLKQLQITQKSSFAEIEIRRIAT